MLYIAIYQDLFLYFISPQPGGSSFKLSMNIL